MPYYLYAQSLAITVVAAGTFLILFPDERASMLRSAALLAPFTVLAPVANGVYWSPDRFFGWPVGVEDLVFSLCYGVITWGLARVVAGPLPPLSPIDRVFVQRSLIAGAFGGLLLGGTLTAGLTYTVSSLICHGAVTLAILLARPAFIRIALPAALLLGVYYVISLAVTVAVLGPGFTRMWSHEHILGPILYGIPIDEHLWMVSFAAAWLCVLLWASDRPQSPVTA